MRETPILPPFRESTEVISGLLAPVEIAQPVVVVRIEALPKIIA